MVSGGWESMQQARAAAGSLAAFSFLTLLLTGLTFCASPVWADVLREHDSALGRDLGLPIYKWSDPAAPPKALVVAVHGLVMHGASFDALANQLVGQGFLVVAPDLRGYGRWLSGDGVRPAEPAVRYRKSQEDLVRLVQQLQLEYRGLPVFWIGESMGADLAMRVASTHPGLADGLVLSSPAIKGRNFFLIRAFAHGGHCAANPFRQIDLTPVIKRCASEDPRVVQGILDDPLSRKHLSPWELLLSNQFVRASRHYIKSIPPTTPVLIIQGSADRTLKANAVVLLIARLKSVDQTVCWFPDRGHVLLETSYLQPDAARTVEDWLIQRLRWRMEYESARDSSEQPVQMD